LFNKHYIYTFEKSVAKTTFYNLLQPFKKRLGQKQPFKKRLGQKQPFKKGWAKNNLLKKVGPKTTF